MTTVSQTMTEAEWLEWRRGGIGASDAPAVLGVCPHRTRLAVYLSKLGREPQQKHSDCRWWGNALESLISEAYCLRVRTGLEITARQHLAESSLYPWMRASIDGVRVDGRPVEFKSLGVYQANNFHAPDGDWEQLPENWIVQVHHQMVVMGVDACDVAVFYPLELRVYTVPRSEELCNLIIDLTGEVWDCVVDQTPPRTADARDHERLLAAYPRAHGEILIDDPELIEAVGLWEHAKDKASKVKILDAMGSAAVAELPNGDLVRRTQKTVKGYVVPDKTKTTLTIERRENRGTPEL